MIVAYLDEMDVDAKAFTLSTLADKDGMIWLNPELASLLNFANNGKIATTAEIMIAEMKPFLSLEQSRHTGITKLLLYCQDRELLAMFGIEATDEYRQMVSGSFAKRTYFEFDWSEDYVIDGSKGADIGQDYIWLTRKIDTKTARRLLTTKEIGGWVDGHGALRWGSTIELLPVSEPIESYIEQCFST